MQPNFEEFSIIWLDAAANNMATSLVLRSHLQLVISHIITFDNSSKCIDFIQSNNMTTDKLGKQTNPSIYDRSQISYIRLRMFYSMILLIKWN
jgi:hypothetical protein